jgi:NAD(P)-dependent dehydrogenase (short-subunit alcohol dehydrogenase family)
MPKQRTAHTPRLSGQVALITGASRGIGLALAQALAVEGCTLILTARNKNSLQKAGREVTRQGARVLLHVCDVRDPNSVADLATTIRKTFRRLDILINNAGIAHASHPVDRLSIEDWRDVIETNLTGTFLVCRAMLPLMKRGAAIVNNLSVAATRVFPNSSAYNASKHGALGLTNTLREELRPRGIRVIALLPGATDTDIWTTLWPTAPRKKMMSPRHLSRSRRQRAGAAREQHGRRAEYSANGRDAVSRSAEFDGTAPTPW